MELKWAIQTIDVLVDMRGSARKKEAWQAIKAALQNQGAVANEPPTAAAAPLCVKCKKPIVNGYCCGCALDFLPDEA